jgi:hypothetical protein
LPVPNWLEELRAMPEDGIGRMAFAHILGRQMQNNPIVRIRDEICVTSQSAAIVVK